MEAYGRAVKRSPNEFERVQIGSSSPLGTHGSEEAIKIPFQPTSTDKKRKKKPVKEN